MTSLTSAWLQCDLGDCKNQVPEDHSCSTLYKARGMARRLGWLRIGARDYCPTCKAEARAAQVEAPAPASERAKGLET